MKTSPKTGLLPFYLKLYDDLMPELGKKFEGFTRRIAEALEARGITVETARPCRIKTEFSTAIQNFERADLDCIITLHLAYSPSLESIDAVCRTKLPIIILDTTMDANFGLDVSPEKIMFNHGIHGVMDFASMLKRRRRAFEIIVGHDSDPLLIDRTADTVRAAFAARSFFGSRVLRIGEAFKGMGDFSVPEDVLASKLGVSVTQTGLEMLDKAIENVSADEVESELAEDSKHFDCDISREAHERSVKIGLGLRRLIEEGGYSAMSINFEIFDRKDRLANTMPFLEISKAMARGIGYAGEGDVLTAALVGALSRAFGETTFTEIFCADWAGNRLFLSHMGEISPSVAADRPRIFEKPFLFGGGMNPAVLTCSVRPGPAVFVNLAPGPEDSFSLIVSPVEVLAENDSLNPGMRDCIRIWIRPAGGVTEFLEKYSCAGGTHHSALVLGDKSKSIVALGRMLNIKVVTLDKTSDI
jgi:L-arabinose isomerase